MVSVGRRAVIAVAEFVSGGCTACARCMVACPTIGVDVIEERFVIVDAALVPRREFRNRPETLLVVHLEAVVGESDWLALWRRVRLVEQTAPRFDR
jgi:Fe-S-cluster-containing hydrogenase component 2